MKDNTLSISRIDNTTNQLKLNGYYFDKFGNEAQDLTIYFLYSNGIILYGSSTNFNELEALEDSYISGKYYDIASKSKYFWGTYEISSSTIKFERWYPGDEPYKVFIREGLILNDTSFHITKFYNQDGGNQKERDEIYRFREFSSKPDSTNVFIK